ncbi:MAG: hypothetical protein LBK00_10545 [Treponema sp.]|nr:hypothetical protein [Treponema sp.]
MDKTSMENKKTEDERFDSEVIIAAIRRLNDKDSKAYKVTEYYRELTTGNLDDGGIPLARGKVLNGKVLNIEKELRKWTEEHPNKGATIMQPEENALILINDLRNKELLK